MIDGNTPGAAFTFQRNDSQNFERVGLNDVEFAAGIAGEVKHIPSGDGTPNCKDLPVG